MFIKNCYYHSLNWCKFKKQFWKTGLFESLNEVPEIVRLQEFAPNTPGPLS